jgi:hypothetical protein
MAGKFNGTNQFIDLGPKSTTKSKSAFTMCFWIRGRNFVDVDSWFSYSTGTSATAVRIGLKVVGAAAGGTVCRPEIRARATDAEGLKTFSGSGTPISAGSWQHVVGTVDYGANLCRVFIDGALNAQGAQAGGNFGAASTSNTDSLDAAIASREDGTTQFYDGDIADCRLYDRMLGPGEVSTIFAGRGFDFIMDGLVDRYYLFGPEGQAISVVPNLGSSNVPGNSSNNPTFVADVLNYRKKIRQSLW